MGTYLSLAFLISMKSQFAQKKSFLGVAGADPEARRSFFLNSEISSISFEICLFNAVVVVVIVLLSISYFSLLLFLPMASFEIMDLDFPLTVFVSSGAAANNAVDGGALVNGGGGEGGILNAVCSDRGRIDK